MGRSAAFNATLFFTSVFGILASFANSFTSLCLSLFLLGTAIGGSMPTDGTLLLEHMPKEKQYLVTALSVFFSFGSVLSASVALLVFPGNSCSNTLTSPCDVELHNRGWKYLLIILGLITLTMFLARIVFFRLHESPRDLVHTGRHQDALRTLQMISKFNGTNILIEFKDVQDHPLELTHHNNSPSNSQSTTSRPPRARADSTTIFDANDYDGSPTRHSSSNSNSSVENGNIVTQYASTGETPSVDATSTTFSSAAREEASFISAASESRLPQPPPRTPRTATISTVMSESQANTRRLPHTASSRLRSNSFYDSRSQKLLHRWFHRPLMVWWDRVMMVLTPEWVQTTVVVWGVASTGRPQEREIRAIRIAHGKDAAKSSTNLPRAHIIKRFHEEVTQTSARRKKYAESIKEAMMGAVGGELCLGEDDGTNIVISVPMTTFPSGSPIYEGHPMDRSPPPAIGMSLEVSPSLTAPTFPVPMLAPVPMQHSLSMNSVTSTRPLSLFVSPPLDSEDEDAVFIRQLETALKLSLKEANQPQPIK